MGKDTPIYLFRSYLCLRFLSILQRNRNNRMWTYTDRFIIRNWRLQLLTVVEVASANLWPGPAPGDPRALLVQMKSEDSLLVSSLMYREASVLVY